MTKNLVIVESPAKARTIARYLGKDFDVASSFGHIRDLPKKGFGVDLENNFEPTYEVSPDKKKVVADLKKAAKGATIWLASDEDREGEAIAWHITELLGLDPQKTNRIVFHEITQPAIAAAVAKPRTIDMKLVDAQQARRILDRLVGYELSPVLWKKVRTGLSAGRVQSVAVRLIVEREREIKDFKAQSAYKLSAVFKTDGHELSAELSKKITDYDQTKQLLGDLTTAAFKIAAINQRPGKKSPSPPFTTSTLQQEASRKLGYGVRQTMLLAQRLYENGHITYMRTDSFALSQVAVKAAGDYITKTYGPEYHHSRQYQTKSAGAQEAHEAIRPSHMAKVSAGTDSKEKKLYELIWRRAVASQMAAANVEKTEITIDVSNRPEKFIASGEVVKFDGYLKVYGGGKEDKLLPPVKPGQELVLVSAEGLETFSRPPARYSEASLVRKLEALGIGRPSTYAPTIGTIQDRGYIEKRDLDGEAIAVRRLVLSDGQLNETTDTLTIGADRSKLLPTQLAEIVTDFLVKYFGSILDYEFTAKAEAGFDDIAAGKRHWQATLHDFYKQFHPLVQESNKASRAEAAQARELGTDPSTGLPVVARYGRYGPVLQLGSTDDETNKPRFAPMPSGVALDEVTLEQALPMFALPREVGKTEGGEMITANIGRFGPYVNVGKTYVSLKDDDPLVITEARARQLLAEKQEQAQEREIAVFGKIKILRGPYGPYVTDGKKNARVPKTTDPSELTEVAARELLAKAPAKSRYRKRVKKS